MYVITACICMTPYAQHITLHPLFMKSHHFIYDVKSTMSNITSSLSDLCTPYLCNHTHSIMISQKPYVWSHIQYTCDILFTIWYHILYVWQHKTLCGWYHTRHYVWYHLHYRCYHIHSFTPNHSIYDVTTTSGITSHPLYQASHPLYLCHHNLSTDIIPTFLWHHTHYMNDNICTLHNIISTPYVITLLCLCHHSFYTWNHIQHVGPHIHYTCDIRATNLCHHSHSIDNITHALYDIRFG